MKEPREGGLAEMFDLAARAAFQHLVGADLVWGSPRPQGAAAVHWPKSVDLPRVDDRMFAVIFNGLVTSVFPIVVDEWRGLEPRPCMDTSDEAFQEFLDAVEQSVRHARRVVRLRFGGTYTYGVGELRRRFQLQGLLDSVATGLTVTEAARKAGCSRATAYRLLRTAARPHGEAT